jgi:hypothetical protein
MARRAVEILLSEQRAPEVQLVPMTLHERASIGAPARRRPAGRTRETVRIREAVPGH